MLQCSFPGNTIKARSQSLSAARPPSLSAAPPPPITTLPKQRLPSASPSSFITTTNPPTPRTSHLNFSHLETYQVQSAKVASSRRSHNTWRSDGGAEVGASATAMTNVLYYWDHDRKKLPGGLRQKAGGGGLEKGVCVPPGPHMSLDSDGPPRLFPRPHPSPIRAPR